MDLSGSGSGSGCSAAPALASMVLMSELWRLLPGTSHCARTGSTDDGGGAAVWEAYGVVHVSTEGPNTRMGAKKPHVKTKTSVKTSYSSLAFRLVVQRRRRMSQTQSYGSWLFSGTFSLATVTFYLIYNFFLGVECTDVTIASGLFVPGLSIGVASAFEDFDDVGGILG